MSKALEKHWSFITRSIRTRTTPATGIHKTERRLLPWHEGRFGRVLSFAGEKLSGEPIGSCVTGLKSKNGLCEQEQLLDELIWGVFGNIIELGWRNRCDSLKWVCLPDVQKIRLDKFQFSSALVRPLKHLIFRKYRVFSPQLNPNTRYSSKDSSSIGKSHIK